MARNAELEAAIVADPESEAGYLVYGDWLQARGDPRGELIAVQLALETARGAAWGALKLRERALLHAHGPHLLGPAASPHHLPRFDWRRGFVDRMRGDFVTDEGEQLMAHPSLALVRAVSGVEWPAIHAAAPPLLAELAIEHHALPAVLARPALRHLAFRRVSSLFTEPDPTQVARSALETLALSPGVDLANYRDCAFPALRTVRTAWGYADEAARTAQLEVVAATPHAELDLMLRHGDGHAPIGRRSAALEHRITRLRLDDLHLDELRPLRGLRALHSLELLGERKVTTDTLAVLPLGSALTRLVIASEITNPEVTAALARSPYAATLASLRLAVGTRAACLALGRGAFPALRALDVDLPVRATPGELGALADALPALEELAVPAYLLGMVSESPLGARVQTLALRGLHRFELHPQFVTWARRLPALRRIRLATRDSLSPETIAALAALDVPIEQVRRLPQVTDLG